MTKNYLVENSDLYIRIAAYNPRRVVIGRLGESATWALSMDEVVSFIQALQEVAYNNGLLAQPNQAAQAGTVGVVNTTAPRMPMLEERTRDVPTVGVSSHPEDTASS
jgi:hypothetical protein